MKLQELKEIGLFNLNAKCAGQLNVINNDVLIPCVKNTQLLTSIKMINLEFTRVYLILQYYNRSSNPAGS